MTALAKISDAPKIAQPVRTGRRGRPPLDPEVRRNRIIEVASELFIANGYADTTVEAVGKAAGVTKRTIYELVGDKPALFRAVCNHCHASIGEIRLDLPVSGRSLRANLIELAHLLIDHSLSWETIAIQRLIVIEAGRFPDLIRAINAANRNDLNRKLAVVFEKLQSLGMIGPVDTYAATELFFDLVVGNVGFRKTLGFDEPLPSAEETAERVSTFIDGYLRRHGLSEV